MDERVSLIVKFTAAGGMEKALCAALVQLVEPSRSEPGNLYYNLFAMNDPKIFIIHESWENRAASVQHTSTLRFGAFRESLKDLLDTPYEAIPIHEVQTAG